MAQIFIFFSLALCTLGSLSAQTPDPDNPFSINKVIQQQRQDHVNQVHQRNQQVMRQFGYESPPDPEQIKDPFYAQKLELKRKQQGEDLYKLIKESNPKPSQYNSEIGQSQEFLIASKCYSEALAELKGMLDGRKKPDFKRAVFLAENAFYNNALSYKEFSNEIDRIVSVCRKWIKRQGYDTTNKLVFHKAIYSYMCDTIREYSNGKLSFVHYPVSYDFEDYSPKGNRTYRASISLSMFYNNSFSQLTESLTGLPYV